MAEIDLKFMQGDRKMARAMGNKYPANPGKKTTPKKTTKRKKK